MRRTTGSSEVIMKLKIATRQFPVDKDVKRNYGYITRQMRFAIKAHVDVVCFSEVCLGGYASAGFKTFRGYNWYLMW